MSALKDLLYESMDCTACQLEARDLLVMAVEKIESPLSYSRQLNGGIEQQMKLFRMNKKRALISKSPVSTKV